VSFAETDDAANDKSEKKDRIIKIKFLNFFMKCRLAIIMFALMRDEIYSVARRSLRFAKSATFILPE
jgi:hypothetical protein